MALKRVKISRAAEKLVRQGRFDAAIAQYQRLLDESPDDLATLNKIGDLHCRAGQPRRALTCFRRIAEHYRDHGFAQKAVAMYKKIAKLDPSSTDSLEELVALYQDQGLTREALRNLREAARIAAEAGDMTRALELECRAMEMSPEDWRGQASLARRLRDAGESERAVAAFLKAADGFAGQGATDEAVSCCHEALSMAPLDPEPARYLCRLLIQAGDPGRAVSEIEALLDNDPGVAHLRVFLGEALLDDGQAARAREALDAVRGSADAEGNVDYHVARVTLDLAEGQAEKALGAMETVVPLLLETERVGAARDLLCRVLEQAAPTGEALEMLLEVSRREADANPAELSGWQLLRRLLPGSPLESALDEVTGYLDGREAASPPPAPSPASRTPAAAARTDDALPALAPEDELDPDESVDEEFVAEHLTEADVFIKYKLLSKAIVHLEHVTERYPCTVVAHQRLVELYLELGEREQAVGHSVALARAHQKKGALDAARTALQDGLRYDPDNVTLQAMRTALQQGRPLPPYRPKVTDVPPQEALPDPTDVPPQEALPDQEGENPAVPQSAAAPEEAAAPPPASPATDEDGVPAAPGETEEVVALLLDEEIVADEVDVDVVPVTADPPADAPAPAPAGPADEPAPVAAAPGGAAVPVAEPDGGFFDLAGALEADLAADENGEASAVVDDRQDTPDPASGIRRAIQDQVGDDDHQTHYQLGIAFKEMGMLDEAIGAFQQASRDPDTFAACCSMLGLCFREKGMPQIAEKWYRRGLENMSATNGSDERLGLIYDLAELHLSIGELSRAREGLTEVYANNANYREVAQLLRRVEDAAADGSIAESTP